MTQEWISSLAPQGLAADGSDFGAVAEELVAARDAAVVAPLTDLGLIRASGADAAGFLHNLLTNDINGITPGGARFAGFCTPKGRLLALFLIWREGDDFLLMLPRDILPAMLKKLSMYVLRSKVKLKDATGERALIGYSAPAAVSPTPTLGEAAAALARFGVAAVEGGQAIRLDDTRWLLALDAATAASRWQQLTATAKPVGLAAWQWLEIAAGQPRVVAATQEAFVPQMLNMELPAVAGVSFSKGCYPGQEIVARTQYLGKVKRRTFRARLATAAVPGAHVYAPETGDQHCGAVVSVAPSPAGGFECLVCVQIGAVEAGEVHVGAPAGERLKFLPLPYEMT
ncbi:MAG: glycine cleavage T-protein (aminomethyl transferase) [Rhodocyclaceae bacterium]|nr:MAG: glycine cleavage T-protein (aminomethyl transferase) [Rhodocyclaceae bacterium]TNC99863.1 MAG: glycine cleavage T-protein (aminomethyl transferase) [Rhodocyclaceae bacterium]